MRRNILKNQSTRAERKFSEALKRNKIPFRFRTKVLDREVDFLIGDIAIEIDGHEQDRSKNKLLLEAGYHVIHLSNREIHENKFKNVINQCQQKLRPIKSQT